MPSVTRLARDVAAKIWPRVTARARQTRRWARRNPWTALWIAAVTIAVALLVLLIVDWKPYSKHYQAFAPILALAAGLAVAGVTLMRHFAQTDADRHPHHYWTVMENLTAFVRERTQRTEAERTARPLDQRVAERAYSLWEDAGRPEGRSEEFWTRAVELEKYVDPPAADIAAVMTVIWRRSADRRELEGTLDFRGSVLRRAELNGVHLERTLLNRAQLEGARLVMASLVGAYLFDAHLEGAGTTLRAQYVRVCLTCRACQRQRDADLEALIAVGRGDVPLTRLRWRCSWCHSTRIDAVVMSKDSAVVPW